MTHASEASSPSDALPPHRMAMLPETLARVGRLEVRARRVVEGALAGRHDSPFSGSSVDFREHRPYAPGDDPRDVDWKVWARQDRLYVKLHEAETNLRATLLVDASASMLVRDAGAAMSKHEYAATTACVLAYLLARQHDLVGCTTFAEGVLRETPHRTGRNHVAAIADLLERPAGGAKTDIAGLLERAAASLPPRGLVVLISDLLCPPEELRRGLGRLRTRGADVVVLQVLTDEELEFPFEGATRFVGLEDGSRLDANPRALRDDYLAALERHQEAIRRACGGERADYGLLRTSQPLDAALVSLTARRAAHHRR